MKQLYCLTSGLLIIYFNLFGFNSKDEPGNKSHIIDFENSDAFYQYYNTELEIINDNSNRKLSEVLYGKSATKIIIRISSRIKLNNKLGVEKYAYLSIGNKDKTIIKSFEVTTFKPNGEIIKFDSSQIFHSVIPDFTGKEQNIDFTKYVIPQVGIGDEVEIKYSIELSGDFASKFYGNVFLNNYLPSVHSEYKFIVPYPYRIFYKCYNDFKEPKIDLIETKAICNFFIDSVDAIKEVSNACLADEFPYFYYSIEYEKEIEQSIKWHDLYNEFAMFVNSVFDYSDISDFEFKNWFKKRLEGIDTLNKFQKFEKIYKFILDNYEIVPYNQDLNNKNFFSDYKIDRKNLYKLYIKVFDQLDIQYSLGYGKNKYEGSIDNHFLRKNDITDVLLAYYNKDSILTYIYPHSFTKKFYFGEIPSHLNGTKIFLMRLKNKSNYTSIALYDSLFDIKEVTINRNKAAANIYYRNRDIGVNLKTEIMNYSSTFVFSGFNSTDNRVFYEDLFRNRKHYDSFLKELQKGRDLFKIDSIYLKEKSEQYPFRYSVVWKGILEKFFTYVNDSTIVFSVNEILTNNRIYFDEQYRKLNIVLPSAYTDIQDLTIDFNAPVKFLNIDILNKTFHNEIGSFNFISSQLDSSKIKLTATYVINHDRINKSQFLKLKDLNDACVEMTNARILVGLKKE